MNRLIRNEKGQFVIIVALLIAALTLATVISIHEINIHSQSIAYKPVNEFLLGLTSDMNRALTVALAKYTSILHQSRDETLADNTAQVFMDLWKYSTLTSYSSHGIKIRTDVPQNLNATFLYDWTVNNKISTPSHSFARIPYGFDVNSYGFTGWTGETVKNVQLQITSVEFKDGPTGPATVDFRLMQSDINRTILRPISDLPSDPTGTNFHIGAYNPETGATQEWTGPKTLTYLGSGNYRITLGNINPIRKGVFLKLATPNDKIWIENTLYYPKAQSTTTTQLSPPSPITFGQPITDSATVTGLGAGFPIPSGRIQFWVLAPGVDWTMVGTEKTLDAEGKANSDTYIPLVAGDYEFMAVYLGDDSYYGSSSTIGTEHMTINKATPTVTTKLSATTITLGGSPSSIIDEATVTNVGPDFSPPTGLVSFQVKFGLSGEWSTFSTVGLSPSGKATSEEYTPLAAGNYYFRAVYSGDGNYNSAQSGEWDEPLTVNKATPKVTTLLSPPAIILGGSLTDTATVTGLGGPYPAPTGTVTFEVSIDGGYNWTSFGSTKTLSSGSATSDLYTTNPSILTYYFRANYSGDSNYVSAASGDQDEPLTPGEPSIVTIVSSQTIQLGNSVYDTAIVTGIDGFPIPTGNVTFEYRKGTTDPWITLSTATLNPISSNAAAADSPSIFLTSAGDWYFRAIYSGDTNYRSAATGDTAEPLIVTRANPTVTTLLSSTNIILGQSIFDSATVTGLGWDFPVPTGLITFQVSQDGGSTWITFGSDKTLTGGFATSDSYAPNKAGTNIWYFRAFYQGDDNYNSATSDNAAEPLAVNKTSTTTTTLLSQSTITYGQSITDLATVTGLGSGFPFPTGTVTFQFSVDGGYTWTTFGSPKTLSGGSVISDPYTPFSAGAFNFRAIYSGDSNYNSSSSGATAEPLYVNMTPGTVGDLIISSYSVSGQDAFISNDPDSALNPYDKVNPQLSTGHPSHTFYSNFLLPSIVTADTIYLTFLLKTTMVRNIPYQTIKVDLNFTYQGQTYSIGSVIFNATAAHSSPPPIYYYQSINVAGITFVPGFPVQAIPAGSTLSMTFTLIDPQNRVDVYGGTAGTQIKLF